MILAHRDDRSRGAPWEARLIFAATLPAFVVATLAKRLVGLARPAAAERPSVLGEARQAARTCVAFAFMG